VCKAVTYDDRRKEVVLLLEVTSPSLRPDYNRYSSSSGDNKDLLIIRMSESGSLRQAININFEKASISFSISANSFFAQGTDYVFGGESWGFKTKY
jgi:hypothetical protein